MAGFPLKVLRFCLLDGRVKRTAVRFVFLAQYYGVIPETPQALSGIHTYLLRKLWDRPRTSRAGRVFPG
jgi:hypothetical protein